MHPALEKVTLRQVLAHRAGLPNELEMFTGPRNSTAFAQVAPELMRPPSSTAGNLAAATPGNREVALSRPPPILQAPNSTIQCRLHSRGAVLEQSPVRAWEKLMHERLFQPLGISTGGI